MPNKARRYCAAFPCSSLAVPGTIYCQEHQRAPLAKLADAFYMSPAWRRFRDWYIKQHPLCQHCQADGFSVPSVIVDHVVELKDGGAPYDEGNAQALCRSCHNRKTMTVAMVRGKAKVAKVYSYEEKSSARVGK